VRSATGKCNTKLTTRTEVLESPANENEIWKSSMENRLNLPTAMILKLNGKAQSSKYKEQSAPNLKLLASSFRRQNSICQL
jgi:hypothetical protein